MWMVVGLGNPGPDYARQRHNVGFMALDAVVAARGLGPWRRRFSGRACGGFLGAEKCLALRPETYMNRSGQAVGAACSYYRLPADRLLVIHDEIDLPFGTLRLKRGGGIAGHRGLASIVAAVGKDFWRLRIGIGHPGARELVSGHVLGDFTRPQMGWLMQVFPLLSEAFPAFLTAGAEAALARLRTLAPSLPQEDVSAPPTG